MQQYAEEWQQLCAKAAVEQDPEKLNELVRRINELLEVKENRLRENSSQRSSTPEPLGK